MTLYKTDFKPENNIKNINKILENLFNNTENASTYQENQLRAISM